MEVRPQPDRDPGVGAVGPEVEVEPGRDLGPPRLLHVCGATCIVPACVMTTMTSCELMPAIVEHVSRQFSPPRSYVFRVNYLAYMGSWSKISIVLIYIIVDQLLDHLLVQMAVLNLIAII